MRKIRLKGTVRRGIAEAISVVMWLIVAALGFGVALALAHLG